MTDIEQAAERVREAAERWEWYRETLGGSGNPYSSNPEQKQNDTRLLADAYLAQQPSYAAQAAEIAELRSELEAYRASDRIDFEIKAEIATTFDAWWKKMAEKSARYMVEFGCHDAFEAGAEAAREILRRQGKEVRTAAATFEDSRPVDEAWCRANGFEAATNPDYVRCEVHKGGDDITHVWFNMRRKMVGVADWDTQVDFPSVTTIGQLNHLLAALRPGGVK